MASPMVEKAEKAILVTGGCGYIGSHVVRQLAESGFHPVVIDSLVTGFRELLCDEATLVTGDCGDQRIVKDTIRKFNIKTVMHFAASTVVPESVAQPIQYYSNNVCGSLSLIAACAESGIRNFIFSSTGSVYGESAPVPAAEHHETHPSNPYSRSKMITELMLRDIAQATGLKYAILRYFNVAGADPKGRQGQRSRNATHLIKIASEVACGKRDSLSIYGTDYDTADGTGVRDYIHVEDLASAHLDAMRYLDEGGESDTFNCGYGHGFSVLEVINAVEAVTGSPLKVTRAPRRPGDISASVADNRKIVEVLKWKPRYDDLRVIVSHALAFEKSL